MRGFFAGKRAGIHCAHATSKSDWVMGRNLPLCAALSVVASLTGPTLTRVLIQDHWSSGPFSLAPSPCLPCVAEVDGSQKCWRRESDNIHVITSPHAGRSSPLSNRHVAVPPFRWPPPWISSAPESRWSLLGGFLHRSTNSFFSPLF